MDYQEVKKFVRLVESSEISELEIVQEGMTLRIKKELLGGNHRFPYNAPPPMVSAPPVVTATVQESKTQVSGPAPTAEVKAGLFEVKSPMVGSFFRAPSPEAEPYAQLGDLVRQGQTLCIIEAMKLMNEIECEITGTVVEICVENTKPVEFDQVLFRIKPV
jgi:acetyl-CoA carboxylase biotin carboxyl carrier protein